jgi:Fur family ferric uptake transcriptional regulator
MDTRQPLKLTKQRQIILEELQKVRSHPSADEVYALVRPRLPRISLATVYRNLEVLAEAGLIQKLALAGSQKRFDGMVGNHYHIRCLKCGRVDDVALELLTLGEAASNLLNGYQCVGHRLEFFGICPRCQEEQADIRPPRPAQEG